MKQFSYSFLLLFLSFFTNFSSYAQTDITNYIFGHSLLVHEPPALPTPPNETTVPHWVYLLAQEAGHNYAVAGQYGFLPQHANLPPFSQWGFALVPPAWESDYEPFSDADFTTILITASNFSQWQPSYIPYYGGGGVQSPLTATLDIIDWVQLQEDSLTIYIYENWPDMAGFIAGEGFPPTAAEFSNYHDYTQNGFHDWWVEYHDSLVVARPADNIKMIPVGPIISSLLTETALSGIPILDLYEDNAPHGRPTIYFLASLVTYMAMYGELAPANFTNFGTVHSLVQSNYATAVNYIWAELQAFNHLNGDSRVFCEAITPSPALQAKVFLGGAYNAATGTMSTELASNNLLPLTQPFNTPPWNYTGTENIATDTSLTDITDWILLEVRQMDDPMIIVEQRAALVNTNGTLIDVDGSQGVQFATLSNGIDYHLIVRSRNHLDITNALPIVLPQAMPYDFTQATNVLGGTDQIGNNAMFAGDINGDGVISVTDFNIYTNEVAAINQYLNSDVNMDSNVTVADFNLYQVNTSIIGVSLVRY